MSTYELTFWGSPRIKFHREHDTYEAAKSEANRVYDRIIRDHGNPGAYKAIVHGPQMGKDGQVIW